MQIKKYKANIAGTETEIVGYVTETRKYLGSGCYDDTKSDYVMSVTCKSMPGGNYGTWLVDPESIKEFN